MMPVMYVVWYRLLTWVNIDVNKCGLWLCERPRDLFKLGYAIFECLSSYTPKSRKYANAAF